MTGIYGNINIQAWCVVAMFYCLSWSGIFVLAVSACYCNRSDKAVFSFRIRTLICFVSKWWLVTQYI